MACGPRRRGEPPFAPCSFRNDPTALDDMSKRDTRYQRVGEDSGVPSWMPPTPPRPRGYDRFALLFERFGFGIACVLSIVVIGFLYLAADQLLYPDPAPGPSDAGVPGVAAEDQSEVAEGADTVAVEKVPFSITTDPLGASIYVDGDYVGISPLREVAIAEGRRRISVQIRDYAPFDTVMMLQKGSAALQLVLRGAHLVALPPVSNEAPPETPVVLAEADRLDPPHTDPIPEAESTSPPASAETPPVALVEPSPASSVEKEPAAADAVPVAVEEEESVAADAAPDTPVGELQINSEPPGATVMMAGAEMGVTPLLLAEVETGAQQIRLRHDGYKDFTTTVEVTPAQRSTVNGQLEQRLGTLRILAKPWGDIYIDGDLHQQEAGAWYTTELPPGYHRVRVMHPRLGRWEQVVEVFAGEALPLTIDFNEGN